MFHWICPECGREIAPTVRECPACDPKATPAEPALVGVVEAPARALNSEAPARPPVVRSSPAAFPAPPHHSADLDDLPQLTPSVMGGDNSLRELAAAVGWLEDAPPDPPQAAKIPLAPRPVAAALPARIPEPEPAPLSSRRIIGPRSVSRTRVERPLPLVETQAQLPPGAPQPPARTAAAPGAVLISRTSLAAPRGTTRSGPAPRLAPLADYNPLAGRPLRPAAPPRAALKADLAPRVTLPGPALIAGLVSFKDRALRPILKERRRPGEFVIPARFLRLMVVAVVVLLVLRIVASWVMQKPAPTSRPAASVAPAAREIVSNPLSREIEVTGFRIVSDPGKKSEIQYLVVNHTAARFPDVTVYVTLRTADARPGGPPLCRFSFVTPKLGPFQSKEMSSSIEKINRAIALPEWQDLRADLEIGQ